MKASTGKVLLVAFGHPDNVLSLTKSLVPTIALEVVFVVSGEHYREGVLHIDLRKLAYGLNGHLESMAVLPVAIQRFLGAAFPIRFVKTHDRKLLKDKHLRNLRSCFHAARSLKKEGYSVLHFNGVSGFIVYFAVLLGIRRKIWTLHDFVSHSGEENARSMRFQKMLVRFLRCEYIQHYRYLQRAFVAHYRVSAHLVHHVAGGSLTVFRAFESRDTGFQPGFVLFFGRISRYKGIDCLIEAFKILATKNTKARLIVAGFGKLWFDFNPQDFPNIVLINRYIETGELVDLIGKSSFVVAPYTDATHSAVVATAYVFGKPVVASKVGGLPEVIINGKTGLLVPPGDVAALAAAMEALLGNADLLKAMKLEIFELCRHGRLSWLNITDKMKQIYSLRRI